MGKRRDAREQIEAKIVELGRRQLLDHGAAGLSLRAIARNLGMVSSAVYRYVSSRDELLTLLLVDAYSDLADTVDRARDDTVADSWSDDVIAIARAVRGWAVTNPARWALLYGSPVPGYHAPPDRTAGVATRVVGAFFDAIAAGIATGDIRLTDDVAPQPMSSDFEKIRQEFGFPGDDRVVTKCFLLWAGVVGAISLEVFGQYGANRSRSGFRCPDTAAGGRAGRALKLLQSACPAGIRTCSLKATSADTCGGGKCNLSPFWPLASWAVLRDAHPSRSVADTDRRGYPRT